MAENTFKQNFMTDLKKSPLSALVRTTYKYCKHNLHQRPVSFVSSVVLGGAVAKFCPAPMLLFNGFVVAPIKMKIRDAKKKAMQNIRDAKQK